MSTKNPNYQENIVVNKALSLVTTLRVAATFLLMLFVVFVIAYSSMHYAKPVTGQSMQPTINPYWLDTEENRENYDIVLINRNCKPSRGDIIIVDFTEFQEQFSVDATLLIKRVIALSGDTLNLQWIDSELVITVNGKVLKENFESPSGGLSCYNTFHNKRAINGEPWEVVSKGIDINEQPDGTITIPDGYYFALGDNRGISNDSSEFGPLPNHTIIGVVDTIEPSGTLLNWILRNIFGIVVWY